MQTVLFSSRFSRALCLCRYAIYLTLGGLVLLATFRRGDQVAPVFLYFIVAPVALQAVFALQQRRVWYVAAYIMEWVCTWAMVWLCGLPAMSYLVVAVIFLASNTALWGWRLIPVMVAAGALVVASLGFADVDLVIYQDHWIDGLAACAGIGFLLAICAVAHAQANQLVIAGRTLKSEKQALLRYLPKELSSHIRASHGVRRAWFTVAFIDLVGFTKATQELPAEALVTLLSDFLGSVTTLVEQWGGQVSKFLGDGVLCVFPSDSAITRDNAAVQAVRCVAQLPGVLCSLNGRWRQQGYLQEYAATVGVASGYCCAGEWGSGNRLDYTVIGVPVNLACRLQGEAGIRGGVLLDDVTAALVKSSVTVPASEEINVRGMGALQAFPLLSNVRT